MDNCQYCAIWEAEVIKLRQENAELRQKLRKMIVIARKQKEQIDAVKGYCWAVRVKADETMRQHLPRGTWSLWKGRREIAVQVFWMLWLDWWSLV